MSKKTITIEEVATPAPAPDPVEEKHTPGPWTVSEKYASEVERADGKTIASCWFEHCVGQTITLVDIVDVSPEESAANARLIAAAPEWKARALAAEAARTTERARVRGLTQAVEQCAAWFEEYGRGHAAKNDTDKSKRNFDRAEFARAAIRAATQSPEAAS